MGFLHLRSWGILVFTVFLCLYYLWFWYQCNVTLVKKTLEVIPHVLFSGRCCLELIFLKYLIEFTGETIWAWRILTVNSVFSSRYNSIVCWFWRLEFWNWVYSKRIMFLLVALEKNPLLPLLASGSCHQLLVFFGL